MPAPSTPCWATGAAPAAPTRRSPSASACSSLDGRIPVDTRLPAERDLAERLGLSRTTVTAAYRDLREHGLVLSVRGSGSVARLPGAPRCCRPRPTPSTSTSRRPRRPHCRGCPTSRGRPRGPAGPARRRGFDPIGIPALRAAIADRLHRAGAADHARPDHGDHRRRSTPSGCSRGPSSGAATAPSSRRRPTRTPTRRCARRARGSCPSASRPPRRGGRTPTDDLDDEARPCRAIRHSNPVAAYLMPDFQNPTGRSMSGETRERVLDAAARQGTVVIADETTAELDIDRRESLPADGRLRRRGHGRLGRQDRLGRRSRRLDPRRPAAHPAPARRALARRPRHAHHRAAPRDARARAHGRHPRPAPRAAASRARPARGAARRTPSPSGRCRTSTAAS